MSTLYERLDFLCKSRGIKGAQMCRDLGFSKSMMTDLKMGRKKGLSAAYANKIANYFGVSVDYLLTGEVSEPKSSVVLDFGNSTIDITQKENPATQMGSGDDVTKELYDFINKASPDELDFLIASARLIKSRRNGGDMKP